MKPKLLFTAISLVCVTSFNFSCSKEANQNPAEEGMNAVSSSALQRPTSDYNLEVVLRGSVNQNGHIRFRQEDSINHIVTLETTVHNLSPNHDYLLQRATETNLDGDCMGTNWLTLGKGPVAHAIHTNDKGDAREELWRNLSAFPTGATFDIHFRVLDATTMAVVLTSDCYQFTIR